LFEFGDQGFSCDVSYERVLCEGASAKATDGGIESSAASLIGCADFRGNIVRTGVEMDADLRGWLSIARGGYSL